MKPTEVEVASPKELKKGGKAQLEILEVAAHLPMTEIALTDTSKPTDTIDKGKQQTVDGDADKGNVQKERPPIDVGTLVASNQQAEHEQKAFLPKKKRYTRYTRLDQFE